jgi:hypothetical protein
LTEVSNAGENSAERAPSSAMRLAFIGLSLILALLAIVVVDVAIRLAGLDQPHLSSPLMPAFGDKFRKVHQNDDLVFYSLRPNITDVEFGGSKITTNGWGLRTAEFGDKAPDEYRILLLGESSAFGAGVEDDETYAYLLEKHLRRPKLDKKVRVINAAVSAYSSFQSRVFLEERGLALEPDMVLIYHELADFLPTANRDKFAPDSMGLALSDKELYESRRLTLNRRLLATSAIYRLITHAMVRQRVESYQADNVKEGADHIVLLPLAMRKISTPEGMRSLKLPSRVPLEDRRENLDRMLAFCQEHNIQLVIMHPSYGESKRHECDLTEFAAGEGVPIFDTYDSLHPTDPKIGELYWDPWHPNAAGHRRIAAALHRFLVSKHLVPIAESTSQSSTPTR